MGLNEKTVITSRPPIPRKSNGTNGKMGKVTDTLKNSPYKSNTNSSMSESGKRLTRSALTVRSQSVDPTFRKAGILSRKQSDPEIKYTNKSHTKVASKPNLRKLTKSSRLLSTDSDHSSDKNYSFNDCNNIAPKNDTVPKKKRPFSFSSDFQEMRPMTSPAGDVQSFLITRPYQNRLKKKLDNESEKGFRSVHVHFSDFSHASKIKISEQPEETVQNSKDSNSSSEKDDTDCSTSSGHIEKQNSNEVVRVSSPINKLNQELENAAAPAAPSGLDMQRLRSLLPSSRDEIMIAKTDDLILEVARFITQIKSSRAENFPIDINFDRKTPAADMSAGDYNRSFENFECLNNSNQFNQSTEALSTITCPSAVFNDSARSNFRDNSGRASAGVSISRPASASASMIRSVSNEDIHGRISLTLRMIEQEERRELQMRSMSAFNQLQELNDRIIPNNQNKFVPSVSNPASRPQSQSSFRSGIFTQEPLSQISFYESTPRLTNIESPVRDEGSLPQTFFIDDSAHRQLKSNESVDRTTAQVEQTNSIENHKSEIVEDNCIWETSHEKTRKIFSFLDEVERSDRETLFELKYDGPTQVQEKSLQSERSDSNSASTSGKLSTLQTIDSLIRKGSVELAREQLLLERSLEESQQKIQVLEESLIQQRELNMRNLRNSERDLKKRLKLQKEEFDIAFTRNEALINEMAAEKRILQERFDKLIKSFDNTEEKYREQIKMLQQKHLEEIKRLRKAQINAENVRKQQWVGNKTQEIRELTVKGLEPEVQRLIQRHQQEMNEMRAWHSDEIRETEERYQRKISMQLQDMRDKFSHEMEEVICRERDQATKKLDSELKQREDEFEAQRRRLTNDLHEERERAACEEMKIKDIMQESLRKSQIKGEIEIENLKQEYENKLANLERRHETELKTIKDVHEAEKDNWMSNYGKKYELAVKDKESQVTESLRVQMDIELREREKKLREEFDKIRIEDELVAESRIKRAQEKFQAEITEMDQTERDLKNKYSQAKSELSHLEEQVFTLKTSLAIKEKQINELQESNTRMIEERSNLTSLIRREFTSQIETLEDDVRKMKITFVELQSKHQLELEKSQLEIKKMSLDKDSEIDKIAARVKQTVSRKEETIIELQKQLEKANFQIQHLEQLLDQQRKDLLQSMTKHSSVGGIGKRK